MSGAGGTVRLFFGVAGGALVAGAVLLATRETMLYPDSGGAALFFVLVGLMGVILLRLAAGRDGKPEDTGCHEFTWEDVDGLRERARNCRNAAENARETMRPDAFRDARDAAELFDSVADRVAALLPPREDA